MEYLSSQNAYSQYMNPYFNNLNVLGTLTVNIISFDNITVKNITVTELATVNEIIASKGTIGNVLSNDQVFTCNGLALLNNLLVNDSTSLNSTAISGHLTVNNSSTFNGLTKVDSTLETINMFAMFNVDAQTFNSTGLATFDSLQVNNNANIGATGTIGTLKVTNDANIGATGTIGTLKVNNDATINGIGYIAGSNTIDVSGYNTIGSYFVGGLNLYRYIKTEVYGATVWSSNSVNFNGGPDYTNPIKVWYYPGTNNYYTPSSFNLAYNLFNAGPFYYGIYNLSVTPTPTLLALSNTVNPTSGFSNLTASIVMTMPTSPCILGVAIYLGSSFTYAQFYGLSVGYSLY
jgi:hypothetical protein